MSLITKNTNLIKVRGARTNNLKNINLDIPKDKLTVITGLSGSGKSSLAFDTIYAEGQRRYVESLSAYARQFLGLMDKPDVDLIEGLSPAISIDQKSTGHSPRSTVGTVTEIYDYLRLLYARVGHPRSINNGHRLEKQTSSQIVDTILSYPKLLETPEVKVVLLAPLVKNRKGTYEELFSRFLAQGYVRVRVDGKMFNLEEEIKLDKFVKHNIELVVDRLVVKADTKEDEGLLKRLTDSVELSLNLGDGELLVNFANTDELSKSSAYKKLNIRSEGDIFFSEKLVDPETGDSFPEIEPHSFSFNSPFGACPKCNGLGFIKEVDKSLVYNPRLTIAEGGIYPWNRSVDSDSSYLMKLLETVSKEYGFNLRTPIGQLSEDQLDVLLYGSGSDKKYSVTYVNSEGRTNTWNSKFEGIIPNLERRYLETESEWIRSEIEQFMIEKSCPECNGFRLKKEALAVTIHGLNIIDVTNMSINVAYDWIKALSEGRYMDLKTESSLTKIFNFKLSDSDNDQLSTSELEIGKQVFKEILTRLNFLVSVGLNYLSLSRTARTLSGGEAQRIRLASQIGTGLTGVLYVLDEPSIGLHQRDNDKLLKTLENLRDIGNTVLVVEHDEDTIKLADHVIDIGPLAGVHGGEVVAEGNLKDGLKVIPGKRSLTNEYLTGEQEISKDVIMSEVKKLNKDFTKKEVNRNKLVVTNVSHNNLKGIDLELPLGKFISVTGVSGSGKSSLINDVLYAILAKELNGAKTKPGTFSEVRGLEHVDKVIDIDQSPIGRTPRSNPATYTAVFGNIRDLLAQTKEAKARGYKSGRFSFNVKGGRCEKCGGAGVIQISMQFLPDVYIKCEECEGKRYNRETLQIDYKGKNISDILDMTVEESVSFFEKVPAIVTKLKTLNDVGLGYIKLGQGATTLSGGESQRVKLASELSKRSTGKTVFILDEPTTGLHFEDVRKLLIVLHGLVAKGNTVIVIEHNLDVIKLSDHIIDLGPEGGNGGGYIIAEGNPTEVANTEGSYTGLWLKKLLEK